MRSGIALDAMDPQVRPQDDLYGHVSGRWLAQGEIPADRSRYGSFDVLHDVAESQLKALLEDAAAVARAGVRPSAGSVAEAVGALYAAMLDEARVEELGLSPVAEDLAAVDQAADTDQLWRLLGRLQRQGAAGLARPVVSTDDRDAATYVVYLDQGGLSLPDESYYREERHEGLREQFLAHVERMFTLAARPHAAVEAAQVLALETTLAAGHWDRVANRDALKTYTKLTADELAELAPQIPWEQWRGGLGAPGSAFDVVIARQPSFLAAASRAQSDLPMDSWRAWLRYQVLRSYAAYLPDAFVAESFDFYGRALTGTPQLRERWKRAISVANELMGEALGQLYVERHFPPEAKERMRSLVANLVEAYRRDIADLSWMSPSTRAAALAKLEAFTPKIGYPDTWRDYSALRVDPGDLMGNVRRGRAFEADRNWAKLGGPVDRAEWFMPPQTVNAYYNPGMNEIVFPAAILQPPFFDVAADDAANYGAIGSVIGHEIGHGFDDQGSRFDGTGNLVDWWTESDRAAFEALAARLIAQYDAFEPRELPGERVNGALTVGENIGDLGGVTVAHLAYRISLAGAEPPVIDGLTGDQRFFAGWAQIWRMLIRPEEAQRLLAIDPHSPGEFRANIVRNLAEFHAAYGVRPGDGLWLDEADRVRIW